MQIHEILQFFVLAKRKKSKVKIENANMRIIKRSQQFHNKSYATNCY